MNIAVSVYLINTRFICTICDAFLQVENATWMLTVFTAFGQHFCLHFEAFQQGGTVPVYMAFLRFMGEEDEAQSFRYSLEVGPWALLSSLLFQH